MILRCTNYAGWDCCSALRLVTSTLHLIHADRLIMRAGAARSVAEPAARAALLFQQRKEEEDRGRGGFVIFQNLRDLIEK